MMKTDIPSESSHLVFGSKRTQVASVLRAHHTKILHEMLSLSFWMQAHTLFEHLGNIEKYITFHCYTFTNLKFSIFCKSHM